MSVTHPSIELKTDSFIKAARVYELLATPVVQHIVGVLSKENIAASKLTTSEFKYHTVCKYLRKLESFLLVRRERIRNDVTYRLNHDRLIKINIAAGEIT